MTTRYVLGMLVLCFVVWAIMVDHAVLPKQEQLQQDTGTFSRYRINKRSGKRAFGPLKDEIVVYVGVGRREQLYYIDYEPRIERSMKFLKKGAAVELGYAKRFPKIWKRYLYEVRSQGLSLVRFPDRQIEARQQGVWKVTAVIGAVFMLLFLLGLIKKPRKKKEPFSI